MSDKYNVCRNCIFQDDAIPEVCEGCDDGDQFERIREDDDDWDEEDRAAANTPVFRVIPILEAA